jgi:hypothetical protein
MKEIPKRELIKIGLKATFTFSHRDNAERVALALCAGGYFTKILNGSSVIIVEVYERC